jgi:cation diffusion facilitator family transporter
LTEESARTTETIGSNEPAAERGRYRNRLIAISLSLIVGAALMGLKFYVYYLTQSSAVLSDALESIINVVASAFALGSVVFSAKPPDPTHPYGHGKIEFFSAGFEGALIIIAAIGIGRAAYPQILNPHGIPHLENGLLILLGAGLINLFLGVGLVRVGKRTSSLVLVADGKHVMSDVYTSAGVLVGLFLVHITGWYWLDGAIALLVAVNILVIGAKLVHEAFAGLMDASDAELLSEISRLIASHRSEKWIDIHRLRAWRAGNRIHMDFHLILPRDLSLEEAHAEVMKLHGMLKNHLGGMADALIHAEPCTDPECPICGYDPCGLRREPTQQQNLWRKETLTSRAENERRTFRSEDQCELSKLHEESDRDKGE